MLVLDICSKEIMLKKITIIQILFLAIIFAGEIKDQTETYLKNYFDKEVNLEVEKYFLPLKIRRNLENQVQQRFYTDFVYLYSVKENDKIIAYAILDNVLGKVQPITFLVIYDMDFSIKETKIIKYREEHGSEVQNDEWRRQFLGKTPDSKFQLDKDIDGISGATISVKSLIKGVKKTTLLIQNIVNNEKY